MYSYKITAILSLLFAFGKGVQVLIDFPLCVYTTLVLSPLKERESENKFCFSRLRAEVS